MSDSFERCGKLVGAVAALLLATAGFPGPAFGGVPSLPVCPENSTPGGCHAALEIDPHENVVSFTVSVPPRSTEYITITLATEENQGRTERTIPFSNATDHIVSTTWTVPWYNKEIGMRIVRIERHYATPMH